MSSIERNSEDWREIRSRVDSIAHAVFLIAGGALSLSITVVLGKIDSGFISSRVACLSTYAWYALLGAVFMFLLLKAHLVFQAYLLQFHTAFLNKHLAALNGIGWFIGIVGFLCFVGGLLIMVRAAGLAVSVL
jgi:hypothetical protein